MNTPAKLGNTGLGGGSVSQACAACKYQRRRCPADCPLAPHFPADMQNDFLNVHKVFGVKNILRTLKDLPPHQHQTAVNSFVLEAHLRSTDPVGGCLQMVRHLNQSLQMCIAELNLVRQQLAVCRSRAQHKREVKHKIEYDRILETYNGAFDDPMGFDGRESVKFEKKAG